MLPNLSQLLLRFEPLLSFLSDLPSEAGQMSLCEIQFLQRLNQLLFDKRADVECQRLVSEHAAEARLEFVEILNRFPPKGLQVDVQILQGNFLDGEEISAAVLGNDAGECAKNWYRVLSACGNRQVSKYANSLIRMRMNERGVWLGKNIGFESFVDNLEILPIHCSDIANLAYLRDLALCSLSGVSRSLVPARSTANLLQLGVHATKGDNSVALFKFSVVAHESIIHGLEGAQTFVSMHDALVADGCADALNQLDGSLLATKVDLLGLNTQQSCRPTLSSVFVCYHLNLINDSHVELFVDGHHLHRTTRKVRIRI
ncbi:hypothetical protein HG531_008314 [Fusarium graminearum]|nr:hypothetical protein HG531_008314 [Fusarium graminearum]